jgi:hypothetical protein
VESSSGRHALRQTGLASFQLIAERPCAANSAEWLGQACLVAMIAPVRRHRLQILPDEVFPVLRHTGQRFNKTGTVSILDP